MECPVCTGTPRPKLHKDGIPIVACTRCGLAYWDWEREPSFRPEALYDAAYFESAEAGPGYDDYAGLEASFRRTFQRRFARLPAARPGARLLDIGAAYGFAVAEACEAGWRAVGIEISPSAAARAREGAPLPIAVAHGEALPFSDGVFDAVTLWDVLEHLPHPHAAMAEVSRVLAPGGRCVLTTGDVESWLARLSGPHWHLYTLPEHLFFYSRDALGRLLAGHGLQIESITTEAAYYTLGYLVERLRKTLVRGRAHRAGSWPGASLSLPVNLFDIVTVRAVRRPDGA